MLDAQVLRKPGNIRGLEPRLPIRGRIKIGAKAPKQQGQDWQRPIKFEHFVVTTTERDANGNFKRDAAIHEKLGEKPTIIPIRLLYNRIELNFQSSYSNYHGRTRWCFGNGEVASRLVNDQGERQTIECPCARIEPAYVGNKQDPPCKPHGKLVCMIEDAAGIGGAWDFRTTSWNSILNLQSSLAYVQQITGGRLAGIPLKLCLRKKTTEKKDGSPVDIWVVSIEYEGTVNQLQHEVVQMLEFDRDYYARLAALEKKVAETAVSAFDEENPDDLAGEFIDIPPDDADGATAETKGSETETKDTDRKTTEPKPETRRTRAAKPESAPAPQSTSTHPPATPAADPAAPAGKGTPTLNLDDAF